MITNHFRIESHSKVTPVSAASNRIAPIKSELAKSSTLSVCRFNQKVKLFLVLFLNALIIASIV